MLGRHGVDEAGEAAVDGRGVVQGAAAAPLRERGEEVPEPDLSAESTPTGGWCRNKQAFFFGATL